MQTIIKSISDIPAFLANRTPAMKVVMMEGEPGVGKTSVMKSFVESSPNYEHLVTLRPSQMEATDFALPVYDRDEKSVKMMANAVLPTAEKTVLFIDEFGQGGRAVQKPLMQLMNSMERGIGSHYRLPDDCLVVAASNGLEHGSGVEKQLVAMSDRLLKVKVAADLDKWCVWAIQNGVPTEIIAYLRFNRSGFCQFDRSKPVNPNPRNWHYAGMELLAGYDEKDRMLSFIGCVGEEQAVNLTAFLGLWGKLPNLDEILRDPKGAPLPEDDGSMGALYAIAGAIANVANRDNFGNVIQYLNRIDKEFEVFSVQTMIDKQRGAGTYEDFVKSSAYINWCVENQDVIL